MGWFHRLLGNEVTREEKENRRAAYNVQAEQLATEPFVPCPIGEHEWRHFLQFGTVSVKLCLKCKHLAGFSTGGEVNVFLA